MKNLDPACHSDQIGYRDVTMTSKQTLLIAVLWTLLLAPSACLSGAMDHFCPCCPDIACGHEIECSADPCNIVVAPASETRVEEARAQGSTLEADFPPCFDADSLVRVVDSRLMVPPPRTHIPAAPVSSLPLLC